VEHDRLAVLRFLSVELYHAIPVLCRQADGGKRAFGCIRGDHATSMSNQKGTVCANRVGI
jgi:hypothetical protein